MLLPKSLLLYRVIFFIVQESVALEVLTRQSYELEASNCNGSSSCHLQLHPCRQLICTNNTNAKPDAGDSQKAFWTLPVRMRSKRWVLKSRQNPQKRLTSGSQSASRSARSRPSSGSVAPQRAPKSRRSSESMASRKMPKSGSSFGSMGSRRAPPKSGSSFGSMGSRRAPPKSGSSFGSMGSRRAPPKSGSSSGSFGSGRAPKSGSSSGLMSAPRTSKFNPSSRLMPEPRIPKAHPLPNSKKKRTQERGFKPKESISRSRVLPSQRPPKASNRFQNQIPRAPGPRRWSPTKPPPIPLDKLRNQRKLNPKPANQFHKQNTAQPRPTRGPIRPQQKAEAHYRKLRPTQRPSQQIRLNTVKPQNFRQATFRPNHRRTPKPIRSRPTTRPKTLKPQRHWTPRPSRRSWTPKPTRRSWTPRPTRRSWTPRPTRRSWTPKPTRRSWTPRPSRRPWTPKPTRRPSSHKSTRRPWTPKPTRRPWTPKPTLPPSAHKSTRRPWTPKPTRPPSAHKSTRRPWTPKPTRPPSAHKSTRRPWTPKPTRPPSAHKSTRRPWTPKPSRPPWTPSPTQRRKFTTRSRIPTPTRRNTLNAIPTEQLHIPMEHKKVQLKPKEHESAEEEKSGQEPAWQEPNEEIPEAQGSNTFHISFNPEFNINFPQAQSQPEPDDQVPDKSSEISRGGPRHQKTGVETESRDTDIPSYSKENGGSEHPNFEYEGDISKHPEENTHFGPLDTPPKNHEGSDSQKSDVENQPEEGNDLKRPETPESREESTGLRQEYPKEDSDSELPADLTNCICQTESQCNATIGCKDNLCGPFRIKESYWRDAGSIGGDWRTCTTGSDSMNCSIKTVQSYILKYARTCALLQNVEPGYEHYARVHNGGPFGCLNGGTVDYWRKVDRCLNADLS